MTSKSLWCWTASMNPTLPSSARVSPGTRPLMSSPGRPSHGLAEVIGELAHDHQEVFRLPVDLLSDLPNGAGNRYR
jgi:hypothetical protein